MIWLVIAALLLPPIIQPQADSPSKPLNLDVSRLVDTPARYFPPDYEAIRKINDDRVAAEDAAEAARKAAEELELKRQAQAARIVPAPPVQVTGTCAQWMSAAGIADPATAYILIMKESGCNPNAVNSSSGACGIGQQLPCGKWPHQWNDPVGAMIDMQDYVFQRYSSWANALAWHRSHNWY